MTEIFLNDSQIDPFAHRHCCDRMAKGMGVDVAGDTGLFAGPLDSPPDAPYRFSFPARVFGFKDVNIGRFKSLRINDLLKGRPDYRGKGQSFKRAAFLTDSDGFICLVYVLDFDVSGFIDPYLGQFYLNQT